MVRVVYPKDHWAERQVKSRGTKGPGVVVANELVSLTVSVGHLTVFN